MNTLLEKLGLDKEHKEEGRRKILTLAAGGIAGAVSNLAVAPIDTIKDVQKQNQTINRNELKEYEAAVKTNPSVTKPVEKPTSIKGVAKDIWSHEKTLPKKIKAFYRGSSASVLKVAPAMAISFLAFDTLKEKIDQHYKKAEHMSKAEQVMEKLAVSGEWIAKRVLNGSLGRLGNAEKEIRMNKQLMNIDKLIAPEKLESAMDYVLQSPEESAKLDKIFSATVVPPKSWVMFDK